MESWDKASGFTAKAINRVSSGDTGSEEKVRKNEELDLGTFERRRDMLSKWYALKLPEPEKMSTQDLVVHLSTNVFACPPGSFVQPP